MVTLLKFRLLYLLLILPCSLSRHLNRQGIVRVSQFSKHGLGALPSSNLLLNGTTLLTGKVDIHQSKCLCWQLLLHIDQPIQQQTDWLPPPTLGVGASLSVSPQLGRLVTSNPMLPLLPEHATAIHVVS